MSAENEVMTLKPAVIKDNHTIPQRKRKLLGNRMDINRPKSKIPVSQGCHNCTHQLSKYYYWKPSPCENCMRNPSYSFRLSKDGLIDYWHSVAQISYSRRNQLY